MSLLYVADQRVTRLPDGWPMLSSHGVENWEWRLLDYNLREVGRLDGVSNGRLDFNVAAGTRGSGSLTWTGLADDQPDWVNGVLLQPWYTLTAPDGLTVRWPLGVFMPSTPTVLHSPGRAVAMDVEFYDLTLRLRQRAFSFDPYVTNQVDGLHVFVREIIGYAGLKHQIEETDKTARTPMTFLPGTTYHKAVNTILDAAGFFAVYADGAGVLRAGPYASPAERPIVWTFTDGDHSLFLPEVSVTRDWFSIPNRILAYSQETGEEPPMEAEAANLDPDDPLSMVNRGPVDEIIEGVEAADFEVLQSHADRVLASRRSTASTANLEHLPLPISVNDRVQLDYESAGVRMAAAVQTISIDCTPGTLWKTAIREVAT